MAKQLNIDLNFNAHTEQAKTQIQDLKNSLNNLSSSAVGQPLPITGEIMKAQDQVLVLKKALNDAFNVDTGKFDLSKFNSSLKNSGTSLSQIRVSLQSLGVEGQQSFMKLAQSIMSAEVPLGRTNRLLASLGTTLKNTIKWQLSSSMLHGFMSAISSAYGYAQDLNESLNNIRIVTGQSSDQMERFAIKANKAAKALSASTLDYTNAALIYYQQGLSDEEVMARSDVTVKMANVTGQTADQVSDQMTAIWNNFYDGSKSLEYYSDAITALGAATASSSDEIAQGLEKFAAVADTVGLSYEYATSALATVVAETRQAPEVVGTAFKTILARIQGLKLGETLEDGTDLNKYSEALMAVGVNIKTTNGQLKDADTILQETAEKWSTLGEDTKVALAQTVGGMRQYNQFISIMENWDKIEKNKTLAETSEGTLTKQQKIYAESWEGARDRVKAAMEDIYKDLLKDEFFIDLLNGLEKLLTFVDNFVESIGGAKGVLTALGSILLNTFSGQAAKGLENMVYNFKSFVGLAGQEAMTMKQQAYNEFQLMQQSVSGKTVGTSYETQGINAALEQQLFLENELFNKKKSLTDEERETASLLLEQNRLYGEQVILAGQKADKAQQDQAAAKQPLLDAALMNMSSDRANEMFNSVDKKFTFAEKIKTELAELDQAWLSGEMDIDSYKEKLTNLGKEANKLDLSEVSSKIAEAKGRVSETKNGVRTGIDVQRTSSNIDAATETNVKKTLNKKLNPDKDADMSAGINKYVKTTKAATEAQKNFNTTLNNSKKVSKDIINNFNTVTNSTQSWSRSIVSAASGIMSLSMAIQSVKNLGNIWKNEDLSMGEKILQTTTALGMAIPMAINGLKGLKSTFGGLLTTLMAQVQLETAYIALLSDESTATLVTAASQAVANAENKQEVAIKQAGILVQQGVIKEDEKEATAKLLLNSTRKKGLATIIASTSAKISSWAASKLENAENKKGIAVLIAKKIAQDAANASTLAACWVIGLIVAAILALVAVVALLVMAFQDAQRQSIDQKMKDNKVAIDELKESIAETKQEFEEFKSSIESLQESYKVIDGMTTSMGNLSDKIMETNQQVIDLIEKYPKLMEYVTRDTETGLLKISQEGINSIMSDFTSTQYAQQAALAWSEKRQAQWTQQEFGEKYQYTVETDEGEETTLNFGEYDDILEKHASTIMQGTDKEIENIIKNSVAEFSQTISEEGLTYADLRDDAKEYYRQQTIEDNADIVQNAVVASAIYEGTGNSLRAASNKNIKETDAEASAIANSVQSKVDNFDGNWNDHKNYLKDKNNNETLWDTTKQQQEYILKAIEHKFGKDSRYVAQRNGKMVVSVDGQEKEYTETQFKEWLYEALYKDELDSLIASKKLSVDESLKKSKVSSDAVKAMSTEDKANLDNIKYSLEQNIGTVGAQVFESMVNDFTGDDDEVSKLLEFTDTFNNIDWSSGSAAMEQFRLEADRLGIVMSAENQGYLEDYANKMRDNAKLMEGAQNYVNNLNKSIEDQAAEVGLSTTALEEYSDQLKEQSKYQDLTDSQLAKAAINQKKARTALDELAESWDAVKTAVKENDVMSEDYEKGIAALKKAYKELFNMDVSDEFLTNAENIELMEKALEGSQEAFEELSKLAGQDWLSNLDFGETKLDAGAILNVDGFRTAIAEIESLINSTDWTPEMGIDDSYINTLNEYVRAGKVTVDEINSYFGNVHGIEFEQDVEYMKPADAMAATTNTSNTTVTKNTITRSPMVDSDGNEISKGGEYTEEIVSQVSSLGNAAVNENGEIAVPILKPKGDGGNSSGGGGGGSNISVKPQVDVTAGSTTRADTMSKGSGGGGGGGNSKPKKAEKKKKTDVVDRYKRVEDKIDDVSDAMKRAQSAADGLWGQSRINKLNQINNLLGNQLSLLREQKNQVLDNLKTDKNDLISVGKSMGYTVQFDDAGLITNSDAILTDLWKKYSQAVDSNNDGYTDEAEQEAADKIQDQIDEFKDAMEQYDETRELDADIQSQIDDAIRERQANFLEILNHKFEVELTLIEVEEAVNDYYVNKFSKSWYDAAEGISKVNDQLATTEERLDTNKRNMEELTKEFNTIDSETGKPKIAQDAYVSKMTSLLQDSYSLLEQLEVASDEIVSRYSDMFNQFGEEIQNFTDRIEHSSSVLDHFTTLMELTGQSYDYKKMNTILAGQAKLAEDQARIAKAQWETYQADADYYKKMMDASVGTEQYEFYKDLWVTATENAEEAQENFLSNTEVWAEAIKAEVENRMNEIGKILEETFTADFGGSFDQLMKQMEHAEALQEEYLTNTNKIYQTTKLINTAQTQIDKTANTVAKRKLKAFQDETEQLQNQNKLSQFELDVQQAKYELLLAEIALEEAQNAKSVVRLQRDNEGNFGYVYTANQDQVSNAEQGVLDAENNLYNIRLEGANNYASKYVELLRALYDELREVEQAYLNNEITSFQEYQARLSEIQNYYGSQLTNISGLYQFALGEDSSIAEDSWASSFGVITEKTDLWLQETENYIEQSEIIFSDWQKTLEEITDFVGEDFKNVTDTVEGMTTASEDLADQITKKGGLLDTFKKESEEVKSSTAAHAEKIKKVKEEIAAYEELLAAMGIYIEKESKLQPSDDAATNGNKGKNNNNNNNNNNKNNGNSGSSKTKWDRILEVYDHINQGHWGNEPERTQNGKAAGYSAEEIKLGQELINRRYAGQSLSSAKKAMGYDTGGYTGQWGPEGKWALLHEKELVLNAKDTENFLQALELSYEQTKLMSSSALAEYMNVIDNLVKAYQKQALSLNNIIKPLVKTDKESLEQTVTIEANFPNASNSQEIENAFNNLINEASQYANRKYD